MGQNAQSYTSSGAQGGGAATILTPAVIKDDFGVKSAQMLAKIEAADVTAAKGQYERITKLQEGANKGTWDVDRQEFSDRRERLNNELAETAAKYESNHYQLPYKEEMEIKNKFSQLKTDILNVNKQEVQYNKLLSYINADNDTKFNANESLALLRAELEKPWQDRDFTNPFLLVKRYKEVKPLTFVIEPDQITVKGMSTGTLGEYDGLFTSENKVANIYGAKVKATEKIFSSNNDDYLAAQDKLINAALLDDPTLTRGKAAVTKVLNGKNKNDLTNTNLGRALSIYVAQTNTGSSTSFSSTREYSAEDTKKAQTSFLVSNSEVPLLGSSGKTVNVKTIAISPVGSNNKIYVIGRLNGGIYGTKDKGDTDLNAASVKFKSTPKLIYTPNKGYVFSGIDIYDSEVATKATGDQIVAYTAYLANNNVTTEEMRKIMVRELVSQDATDTQIREFNKFFGKESEEIIRYKKVN